MSPYRDRGRGTLVIDLTFRGIGRIKRASGTTDKAVFTGLKQMLRQLYQAGRWEVLERIRDGELSLLQVWRHHRVGQWERIPTAEHLLPLKETLDSWASTYPCSPKHQESLTRSFGLIAESTRGSATVADLPEALKFLRVRCQSEGIGRTFNLARSASQAFLRSTVGKHDPLWLKVSTVERLPEPPKIGKHPKNIEEVLEITEALGPKAGPMWLALCLTGMGPKEYFEDGFEVQQDRILIRGKKRKGRNRVVPLVTAPVRPMLTRWGFRQALRRLPILVTPYDARRTFANLMETAGIPRTRRMMYLGHRARDVTDLYERHEVTAFLAEDARKLLALLGEDKGQLKLVK